MPVWRRRLLRAVSTAALLACGDGPESAVDRTVREAPLFESLPATRTGVTFENRVSEAPPFNILTYLYAYNGGGVAVGDVDGDDRPDLYFSSNTGPNRLYRNLGDFRFEEVTDKAGVAGPPGWKTGVAMADVNGDGALDLYVSAVNYLTMPGRNVLYLNNGDGTFSDRTAAWGLEFAGYSTQATFFDMDRDGDLDLYLLNHSVHTERQIGMAARREERHPKAGDRLYRNDGNRYTDVSAARGIWGGVEGFGLGVMASDLTGDGCPDLYVANDFQENDFLYVNDCRGFFTERGRSALTHTSRFSMGVDAADVTDDGQVDLMTVDMLPEQEAIFKTSASYEGWTLFDMRLRAGYQAQYPRNALQVNRGDGTFTEVGFLAGVAATDWSWSPLFADLDNDGRKDLFITNGIYRRPNDLDYINYVGNEANQAALARGVSRQENQALLERMPQIPLPNHAYRNEGALQFTDQAAVWGLGEPGFSNGAAYADLDGDGALDLVVNRLNAPASIHRNLARRRPGAGHYLQFTLRGRAPNTQGIGARITVVTGTHRQLVEQQPVRGFQSRVDDRLHVGLGEATLADSVIIIWPDARLQILTGVAADQRMVVHQDSATGRWTPPRAITPPVRDEAPARGAAIVHVENEFLDYNREPLMPHVVSAEGPALAVGDVNGDGRDDVYVGGAKWQSGKLLVQQPTGRFLPSSAATFAGDSIAEDVDARFFDADGDGDLDLYVVSAGNEFYDAMEQLADRLYRNDGTGRFTKDPTALPADFRENGGAVAVGDVDADGDLDLFVGSRVVARAYGRVPRSWLLRNDGTGHFTDVTDAVAPGLARAGLVTGAAFTDVTGDGRPDLVVAGEWMPVQLWVNTGTRLVDEGVARGFDGSNGWWNSLQVADLTGDGRPDLVLGNAGRNGYLRASASRPVRMHVHDFTGTGTSKGIITRFVGDTSYPVAGRDDLVKLMPALRQKFPSYTAFGAVRLETLFDAKEREAATVLEARTFASAVAINDGAGHFRLAELPWEAQVSTVFASLVADVDRDGQADLLLGGNRYGVPPLLGRADASRGVTLLGDGRGGFLPAPSAQAIPLDGQIRGLAWVRTSPSDSLLVVARSGSALQMLRVPSPSRP